MLEVYNGETTDEGQTLYCNICGKQLIEKPATDRYYGTYNSNTGKKLVKYICPTGKCGHIGHNHKRTPWGIFSKPSACLKCGDPYVNMGVE